MNKDSACTRKGRVVCCAERALCRESHVQGQWTASWCHSRVWMLVETFIIITHWRSTAKYQELFIGNNRINSDLIPALEFMAETEGKPHVVQNQCNSTSVHVLPREHKDSGWLTLPGEGRESCAQRQGPMSAEGVTRKGRRRQWHSSRWSIYHVASKLVLGQSMT